MKKLKLNKTVVSILNSKETAKIVGGGAKSRAAFNPDPNGPQPIWICVQPSRVDCYNTSIQCETGITGFCDTISTL